MDSTPFLVHSPWLLLYWLGVRLDEELEANNIGIDSRHIGGSLREYIQIV